MGGRGAELGLSGSCRIHGRSLPCRRGSESTSKTANCWISFSDLPPEDTDSPEKDPPAR